MVPVGGLDSPVEGSRPHGTRIPGHRSTVATHLDIALVDEGIVIATDVLKLLDVLHGNHVRVWLDGGWEVDALIGNRPASMAMSIWS